MKHIPFTGRALGVVVFFGCCVAGACAADGANDPAEKLYRVVDGFKVDPKTMNGFRAWRAAACDRCHGANQQGLVGPSLLASMKTLGKADFDKVVTEGRLEKGMPSFVTSKMVTDNLDGLYAYLKGRALGEITQARVQELTP